MTKECWEVEIESWIDNTGWPTHDADILEMGQVYAIWKERSPRCKYTGCLDSKLLSTMILERMKDLHCCEHDAYMVSGMLLLQATIMARKEGLLQRVFTD